MTIQGLNNNPTAEKENTTEETTIRRTNAKNNTHDKPMGNVTMTGPGTKQESYGRQGPYNSRDHNTTDKRKKQHTREADEERNRPGRHQ